MFNLLGCLGDLISAATALCKGLNNKSTLEPFTDRLCIQRCGHTPSVKWQAES